MSRFLLLLIFIIWMACPQQPLPPHPRLALASFFGGYALLVLAMACWGRWLSRRAHLGDINHRIQRFQFVMAGARWLVPLWLGVGAIKLGWKEIVSRAFLHLPAALSQVDLPGLLVGSLPALLAWMGLWWAQYPADDALHQRNALFLLNDNLPVHSPPTIWTYLGINLRLQLLFTLAPVVVLMALRDALTLCLPPLLWRLLHVVIDPATLDLMISVPLFLLILLLGPLLLSYVLHTQPLPDGALRSRLEAICRHHRVGYRQVLLWRTHHHVGNAAVMGFLAPLRYILVSDLLLERMTDEQIEAVFAHEIGHVFHRHMYWLVASIAVVLLGVAGPGQWLADRLAIWHGRQWMPDQAEYALLLGAGVGIFVVVFGYLSRRIERQADVFAARTLHAADEAPAIADAPAYVSSYGAELFGSALQQVAVVNNIAPEARSWCHGSIASRINFLRHLAGDPQYTFDFDRHMRRIYLFVTLAVLLLTAWLVASSNLPGTGN